MADQNYDPLPPHLPLIAQTLGVCVSDLTDPPDFTLGFDWQTRRLIEAMRRLSQRQRNAILRLTKFLSAGV
ncbi:MAG: hypothetical protein L7U45_07220 [Alphaproteobacteria bacterium]|nr:hypothetical protein [Alphaproteobacteria bacterium]